MDDELRFEELLRVHASKAEERILANLPEPGERHVFSERFEWEMRVAIGRAASGKKPRRLGKLGRIAACAAVILASATVFSVSVPTVRASMQQMIMSWFPDHASFHFEEEESEAELTQAGPFELGYLPEGYRLEERMDMQMMSHVEYQNAGGGRISLMYAPLSSGYTISIDNEHSDHHEIEFEGDAAHLFVSNTEGYPSFLLWTKDGMSFCLVADVGEEEIIKLASHIKFINEG